MFKVLTATLAVALAGAGAQPAQDSSRRSADGGGVHQICMVIFVDFQHAAANPTGRVGPGWSIRLDSGHRITAPIAAARTKRAGIRWVKNPAVNKVEYPAPALPFINQIVQRSHIAARAWRG